MSRQVIELPVWDTISAAWARVSGSKAPFWASLAVFFLIMFAFGVLEELTKDYTLLSVCITYLANAVAYFLQFGLLYMGITRAKDLPINFRMLFNIFDLQLILYLTGFYILQLLLLAIPMLVGVVGVTIYMQGDAFLAIIAGISLGIIAAIGCAIVGVRMALTMGLILDTRVGPWTAIKQSFKATRGNFWNLIGLFLLQILIVLISVIPLGIGMIWTLPFTYITYGLMYKVLRGNLITA
jgi:hypothetical protein